MTIFGIDAASYQHDVNWASVDKVCDFGFEKVTEGAGYTNPYWPAAKTAMTARAAATGFLPGAYLFMDFGEGTAQADHFAAKAGSLDGFAIVVDLERAPNGSPTIAQAKACVARLRQRYPNHPIGGYAPHWYTGSADLRFFDYTWASRYASGSGSPAGLYAKVPSSWWAAYGGKAPAILQFSSTATVAGVSGRVDISAFKGSLDQLRALALGARPVPQEDDDMPEYVSLDLVKPQPVKAGQPARIVFTREWADTAGAHANGEYPGILSGGDHGTQFVATLNVYGCAGKWRLIETDPAKDYATSKDYPYALGYFTVSGWCDAKQHLYVEFLPDADGAVSVAAKANYWER